MPRPPIGSDGAPQQRLVRGIGLEVAAYLVLPHIPMSAGTLTAATGAGQHDDVIVQLRLLLALLAVVDVAGGAQLGVDVLTVHQPDSQRGRLEKG